MEGVLIVYNLVRQGSSPKPISIVQMAEIKEYTLYVPTLNYLYHNELIKEIS